MSVPREDPSRALGVLPSSTAAAAPRGEAISHQLAPPLLPRITLPPFQKTRSAGDSPPSIEFVPASALPASHVVDSAVARGPSSAGEEENAGTRWFGSPLERSAPLPVERLRFPWRRFACLGVAMNELLSRERLRPDLLRVRRVYEAGGTEEALLMLGRLTADGVGAAYQIPDAIHSERTFAYSTAEVDYVDQMASYLSDPDRRDPHRFILAAMPGLYVSPRPYAYSRARAALQKSACSLMRLHGVAISPHD